MSAPAVAAAAVPDSPGQASTSTVGADMMEPCSPPPQLHLRQRQQQQNMHMPVPGSVEPAAAAEGGAAGARRADMLPSQASRLDASASQAADDATFLDLWDAMFQQTLLQCKAEDACLEQQQGQLLRSPDQAISAEAAAAGSGGAATLNPAGCTATSCLIMPSGISPTGSVAAAGPLSPWDTPPARTTAGGMAAHPARQHASAAMAVTRVQDVGAASSRCGDAGQAARVRSSRGVSEGVRPGWLAMVPLQQRQQACQHQEQQQWQEQQQQLRQWQEQQQEEGDSDEEFTAFLLSAIGAAQHGAAIHAPNARLSSTNFDPQLMPRGQAPVLGPPAAPVMAAAAAVPAESAGISVLHGSVEVGAVLGQQPCLPTEYDARVQHLMQGIETAADQLRQLEYVAARLGCWGCV